MSDVGGRRIEKNNGRLEERRGRKLKECPECGSRNLIKDPSTGEMICCDCGVVLSSGTYSNRKRLERKHDLKKYIAEKQITVPLDLLRRIDGEMEAYLPLGGMQGLELAWKEVTNWISEWAIEKRIEPLNALDYARIAERCPKCGSCRYHNKRPRVVYLRSGKKRKTIKEKKCRECGFETDTYRHRLAECNYYIEAVKYLAVEYARPILNRKYGDWNISFKT